MVKAHSGSEYAVKVHLVVHKKIKQENKERK
jgi:hypothetical protein